MAQVQSHRARKEERLEARVTPAQKRLIERARVRCAVSRETLDDDFGAYHRDKVEFFRVIEEAARQKSDTETDGSILIHSGELARRKR
jgi:hypothetical protein